MSEEIEKLFNKYRRLFGEVYGDLEIMPADAYKFMNQAYYERMKGEYIACKINAEAQEEKARFAAEHRRAMTVPKIGHKFLCFGQKLNNAAILALNEVQSEVEEENGKRWQYLADADKRRAEQEFEEEFAALLEEEQAAQREFEEEFNKLLEEERMAAQKRLALILIESCKVHAERLKSEDKNKSEKIEKPTAKKSKEKAKEEDKEELDDVECVDEDDTLGNGEDTL